MVFGIISVIGGFLALPLPETRQNPLPETIDDVEHYDEFCRRAENMNGNVKPMKDTNNKKNKKVEDTKV